MAVSGFLSLRTGENVLFDGPLASLRTKHASVAMKNKKSQRLAGRFACAGLAQKSRLLGYAAPASDQLGRISMEQSFRLRNCDDDPQHHPIGEIYRSRR